MLYLGYSKEREMMIVRREFQRYVVNRYNVGLLVEIRQTGDKWGLNDCLEWDEEEPIVEISTMSTEYLISSYYLSTFLRARDGILLDGSNSDYALGKDDMERIIQWIEELELPEFTPSYPRKGLT